MVSYLRPNSPSKLISNASAILTSVIMDGFGVYPASILTSVLNGISAFFESWSCDSLALFLNSFIRLPIFILDIYPFFDMIIRIIYFGI